MRLVNILALTQAKLVNEPFVNSFENIVFDAKKIKRGDLFIAFVEEDIEDAILNGAYGVVFDKPTQISDSEIAWIKVQNIEEAIKKLLRFRLIEKKINIYQCDEVTIRLAQQIVTQNNLVVLDSNVKDIFLSLWGIEADTTILFTPSLTDETLFTDVKLLPSDTTNHIEVKEKTLFETSFIYDNKFYERQLLSPFFIPYLEKLLSLFTSLDINFRLKKFTPIKHFEAVFVNKNLQVKDFGSTDKVVIFESDKKLISSQIDFLKNNASWANIIYLIDIKDEDEVLNTLKNTNFHFALVFGYDKYILNEQQKYTQQVLF